MAVQVDTTGFDASNDGSRERIARFGEMLERAMGIEPTTFSLGS